MAVTAGSRKPVLLAPVHCAPKALSSPSTSNCPSLHHCERGSPMKNRKREICTSGSVRDEDGQPPHLLGRRNFLHLAAGAAALPAVSRFAWAQALFLAMMLAASSLAAAEIPLTIDQLLAQGWEIAGYASGYDNRTSLILFRHPGVNVLVQCGILYD